MRFKKKKILEFKSLEEYESKSFSDELEIIFSEDMVEPIYYVEEIFNTAFHMKWWKHPYSNSISDPNKIIFMEHHSSIYSNQNWLERKIFGEPKVEEKFVFKYKNGKVETIYL